MSAQITRYEEARSSLNWQLLAWSLLIPAGAEMIALILAIAVNPAWFSTIAGVMFVPALIGISLLYRNWPTGIHLDESGITIGAIRSHRARTRNPSAYHQSWGIFSCPWPSVHSVRVVTDPTELRRLARSSEFFTFNNSWGGKRGIRFCAVGVLTSPFMRAALVADIYPSGVDGTSVRPGRVYTNFKDGRFSHVVQPRMSDTWIVPTRTPEAFSEALANLPVEWADR